MKPNISITTILRAINAIIVDRRGRPKKTTADELEKLKSSLSKDITTQLGDKGDEGVQYLNQILTALGFISDESHTEDADWYQPPPEFNDVFNEDLYQKVLPICKLAYLFEQNGESEQHAFKLSTIFNTEDSSKFLANVITYITQYDDFNTRTIYQLHDACLFDLPNPASFSEGVKGFKRWQKYAASADKSSSGVPLLLLHRRFRERLSIVNKLETFEQYDKLDESELAREDHELNDARCNYFEKRQKVRQIEQALETVKEEDAETKQSVESKKARIRALHKQKNKERGVLKKARGTYELRLKPHESDVQKDFRSLKEIKQKIGGTNNDDDTKYDLETKLAQKSKEISQKLLRIGTASQGLPFNGKNLIRLEAFYEKYKAGASKAHNILVENGIDDKNQSVFYGLRRERADSAIPDIHIDGADLKHTDYYINKLDVTSDEGAAYAACLGKITRCCQHLGGIGDDCVRHGIESPNGGFYVLYKKKGDAPDIHDPILAQAWVWRSEEGGLVLDSIEKKPTEDTEMIASMYRLLGLRLCTETNISGCPVNQVNTGTKSGITADVAFPDYPATKNHTKDYSGYSDSASQYKLADKAMPYLFYGKTKATSKFGQLIEKQTEVFLQTQFNKSEPLKNNEAMKQAVAFALYAKNARSLLDKMRELVPESKFESLNALITNNQTYIEKLNERVVAFDLLDEGAYLNAMNNKGLSSLHVAVLSRNIETVRRLIERGINLNIQDKYGNSPIITALEQVVYAGKQTEGKKEMVKFIVEKGAELNIKDKDENTPLIIAVENNDLNMVQYLVEKGADIEVFDASMKTAIFRAVEKGNEAIFAYLYECGAKVDIYDYPDENSLLIKAIQSGKAPIVQKLLEDQSVNIKKANKQGKTPLHIAARSNKEFIEPLLKKIPEKKRLQVLRQIKPDGHMFIQWIGIRWAGKDPKLFKTILSMIPENQRLEAVTDKVKVDDTLIHWAINKPELFQIILDLLSEKDRFQAGMAKNSSGNTVLHSAINKPELLIKMLNSYSETERLQAVLEKNQFGETLLHKAVNNHDLFKTILSLIPENHCLVAAKEKDSKGNTLLQKTTHTPELFKLVLDLYPENERLAAVKEKDSEGNTLLQKTHHSPELFKLILDLYPENERLAAVKEKDSKGNTLLHNVTQNLELFKLILDLYPENERLAAVKEKDSDGNTLLHKAAENTDVFQIILGLYPENERLAAVKEKDMFGKNVLQETARNPELFQKILDLYPENERLAAVKEKDNFHYTVLHYAGGNPKSFKMILELYPDDEKLPALEAKSKFGDTVVDNILSHPESIKIILDLYPKEKRLQVVTKLDKLLGSTMLHHAHDNPKSIEMILTMIPENKRLQAVKQKDTDGNTLLHKAADNIESIKMILDLIPANERLAAIKEEDRYGRTLLHNSAQSPELLKMILNSIPQEDQIEYLKLKIEYLKLRTEDKTVADFLADIAPDGSFAMDYIAIHTILNNSGQANRNALFADSTPPVSLKQQFDCLQSFDEVKSTIIDFLEENINQNDPTARKLITQLCGGSDKTIEDLYQKWGIDSKDNRLTK